MSQVFGNPKVIYPHSFVHGGKVQTNQMNIPRFMLKPDDHDTVFARLMPNEIVIPLPHVKKVEKFLRKENIKLPGL
jgi:hypothetical protein